MSFNSFQSPFNTKSSTSQNDQYFITNPAQTYQSSNQNNQNPKTSEFQPSYFNNSSSINGNYLNPTSKFNNPKFSSSNYQKKQDNWKNVQFNTAKSMVFMGSQKQPLDFNLPKKPIQGLGKLSSMARTVQNDMDDPSDLNKIKNSNFQFNSNKFQAEKQQNFKKYGNTLGEQFSNFKTNGQKQQTASSSGFYNFNEDKNNVYKSFINMSSNNSVSDNKKGANLQFLLKYKKQQQEKKQNGINNITQNQTKPIQFSKFNHNANQNTFTNHQNHSDSHYKMFHQYSAPNLNHVEKKYHFEPTKTSSINKTQSNFKFDNHQYDSPSLHHHNSYSYQNFHSKYQSNQDESPSPTYMKKFNSDKIQNRVSQFKPFVSNNLTTNQNTNNAQKNFNFAKKLKKVAEQIQSKNEYNTPNKQKFISPSFFKNKQNQISQAKTLDSTPSPYQKNNQPKNQQNSPVIFKSTFQEEVSIDYLDGDISQDDIKQWSLDDFQLGDKLGKGAFGDVFVARQKKLGFMCVLKKMSKKRIKDLKRQEHVIRQLKIQMYLNHKHLTAMYGYFHDKDNIYLILEYLPDGNLAQIKKRKKTSQKQTAGILKQVCQGLSFMHTKSIIHRDIKPQNIFCNQGYVKLGDFGCSVFTDGLRKTVVSCLQYSSPQQLSGQSYNEKIDVWGIGILAYELLTGKSPFEKQIMNMSNEQINFGSLKFPQQLKISQTAKDFITSLLNVDPIDRLDVDEALQHKFIVQNNQELPPLL